MHSLVPVSPDKQPIQPQRLTRSKSDSALNGDVSMYTRVPVSADQQPVRPQSLQLSTSNSGLNRQVEQKNELGETSLRSRREKSPVIVGNGFDSSGESSESVTHSEASSAAADESQNYNDVYFTINTGGGVENTSPTGLESRSSPSGGQGNNENMEYDDFEMGRNYPECFCSREYCTEVYLRSIFKQLDGIIATLKLEETNRKRELKLIKEKLQSIAEIKKGPSKAFYESQLHTSNDAAVSYRLSAVEKKLQSKFKSEVTVLCVVLLSLFLSPVKTFNVYHKVETIAQGPKLDPVLGFELKLLSFSLLILCFLLSYCVFLYCNHSAKNETENRKGEVKKKELRFSEELQSKSTFFCVALLSALLVPIDIFNIYYKVNTIAQVPTFDPVLAFDLNVLSFSLLISCCLFSYSVFLYYNHSVENDMMQSIEDEMARIEMEIMYRAKQIIPTYRECFLESDGGNQSPESLTEVSIDCLGATNHASNDTTLKY